MPFCELRALMAYSSLEPWQIDPWTERPKQDKSPEEIHAILMARVKDGK